MNGLVSDFVAIGMLDKRSSANVNAALSSALKNQTCPVCIERNHASDRKYQCSCGFKTHRDIVGAMNIIKAPVTGANGLSA